MAGAKEIRTQIASIKNTQKITRAMEMVAASKMRKAQDRMESSRPYADKMRSVIGHLALAHPEHKHEFLQQREVKSVGYIVVSSDRGLCGGLNNNLFRRLVKDIKVLQDEGVEIAAVALPDEKKGEKVALLVSGEEDPSVLKQKLIENRISPSMLPDAYIGVKAIPKLGSGKKDLSEAKAMALACA